MEYTHIATWNNKNVPGALNTDNFPLNFAPAEALHD